MPTKKKVENTVNIVEETPSNLKSIDSETKKSVKKASKKESVKEVVKEQPKQSLGSTIKEVPSTSLIEHLLFYIYKPFIIYIEKI